MKILVLGAGAIGTVFGGFLAKCNHRVALLGRKEIISSVNSDGLYIKGIWGEHHLHSVRGYIDLEELREKEGGENGFDLALVTVKSYDTENIVEMFSSVFPDSLPVVSFQGGLGNIEPIIRLRGKENVIAGSTGFSAHSVTPNTVMVTACDKEARVGGMQNGIAHNRVKGIADLLSAAGIPTLPTTEIDKIIWNNALLGSALYGLAAVLGVNYGFLGDHEAARKLISGIVQEFFAVLEKENKQVDWADPEAYLQDLFGQLIPLRHDWHSPTFREIQNGKRTEIDAFNGAIVNLAHTHEIDAPLNWLIRNLVKAKENIILGRKDG
jgi:2-dehydropantoate 2-reductase